VVVLCCWLADWGLVVTAAAGAELEVGGTLVDELVAADDEAWDVASSVAEVCVVADVDEGAGVDGRCGVVVLDDLTLFLGHTLEII